MTQLMQAKRYDFYVNHTRRYLNEIVVQDFRCTNLPDYGTFAQLYLAFAF